MQKLNQVFILTGSNTEPRQAAIELALKEIQAHLGEIVCVSSLYESEPWGFSANTNFLNQVLEVSTSLSAAEILQITQQIELALGRNKKSKSGYSSRIIDIDLLYYNSEIIETGELTIPHPRMHERKFTLLPLVEIAPDFMHPIKNESQKNLLAKCNDSGKVWRYQIQLV